MQQNVNMFKVQNNIHIMNKGQEKSADAHKVDQKKEKGKRKLIALGFHNISMGCASCDQFICVYFYFSSKRISYFCMKGKGNRQKETLSMYLVIASRSTHKPVLVSIVVKILDASEQANLNSTEVLNNNICNCFQSLNKITNIR